jgi:hypothetical protein
MSYRDSMGLDSVEIVLRTEEFFEIAISDDDAAKVRTVGDFYVLVCRLLGLVPLTEPVTADHLPVITEWKKSGFFRKAIHLPPPSGVKPWSPESVWNCLVAIFVDQQGLKPDRVQFSARIAEDLGVD